MKFKLRAAAGSEAYVQKGYQELLQLWPFSAEKNDTLLGEAMGSGWMMYLQGIFTCRSHIYWWGQRDAVLGPRKMMS